MTKNPAQVPLKCEQPTANSNSHRPSLTIFPTIYSMLIHNHAFENCIKKQNPIFLKIMSSQANIRNTFLDQKSPWHPEVGVSQQTNVHTDGPCASGRFTEIFFCLFWASIEGKIVLNSNIFMSKLIIVLVRTIMSCNAMCKRFPFKWLAQKFHTIKKVLYILLYWPFE